MTPTPDADCAHRCQDGIPQRIAQQIAKEAMAGPYMYIFVVLVVLGMLGVKMYLQSRSPTIETHRPASPISEADIEAAVRGKRIVEAIQLYGLLYQCDLAEATEAVNAMVVELKAAGADSTDPTGPEEIPQDHRET
jgi:hypothetical protein